MTFEEIVSQARELPLSQRKQLISEIIETLTETLPIQKRIPGLHAGSTIYISDNFDDELPDSFWLGEDE